MREHVLHPVGCQRSKYPGEIQDKNMPRGLSNVPVLSAHSNSLVCMNFSYNLLSYLLHKSKRTTPIDTLFYYKLGRSFTLLTLSLVLFTSVILGETYNVLKINFLRKLVNT